MCCFFLCVLQLNRQELSGHSFIFTEFSTLTPSSFIQHAFTYFSWNITLIVSFNFVTALSLLSCDLQSFSQSLFLPFLIVHPHVSSLLPVLLIQPNLCEVDIHVVCEGTAALKHFHARAYLMVWKPTVHLYTMLI